MTLKSIMTDVSTLKKHGFLCEYNVVHSSEIYNFLYLCLSKHYILQRNER